MRTKTVEIYEFNELSDSAKNTAIAYFRDEIIFDTEWDYYVDMLAEKGFENAKIYYSGFGSQGTGASFTCDVNIEKFFKDKKLTKYERVYRELVRKEYVASIKIDRSGPYYHEKTMSIDSEAYYLGLGFSPEWFYQLAEVNQNILAEAKEQARQIYKSLEAEYEYQRSDEAIIQMIEANDYEFTAQGELI